MCCESQCARQRGNEAHYSNAEEVSGLKNGILILDGYSLRPEQIACATDFVIPLKYYFFLKNRAVKEVLAK